MSRFCSCPLDEVRRLWVMRSAISLWFHHFKTCRSETYAPIKGSVYGNMVCSFRPKLTSSWWGWTHQCILAEVELPNTSTMTVALDRWWPCVGPPQEVGTGTGYKITETGVTFHLICVARLITRALRSYR